NPWAIDNKEGNIPQEEMVYNNSNKAKGNNDTNPYPKDRQR
ncbi:12836_t:CDS:1, partial [Gigaspora margarita]